MKSKLRTITKVERNAKRSGRLAPIHPGEMLRDEFLVPLGMTPHALAMALQVPATRITEIVKERRGISGDTALRLARYFRMTPEYWMNMQSHYELEVARDEFDAAVKAIRPAPIDKVTGELKLQKIA